MSNVKCTAFRPALMTRDSALRPSTASGRPGTRGDTDARHDDGRRIERERPRQREHVPTRSEAHSPDAGPSAPDVSPQEAVRHLPDRRQPDHFGEEALFYAPPYESLLADRLARHLVRHLQPSCGLLHETVALTPRNCFRLDFLIETKGTVRGIERAGIVLGERPEAEGAPDLYDALVVGSGAVDVLYRFDPEGLDAHLADALYLMSEHTPALFERPGRLQAEASRGPCAGTLCGAEVRLSYPTPPVEVQPGEIPERPAPQPDLVMRHLSAAEPAAWLEDYRRALTHFRVPESQHRRPEALRRRAA